jgi:predicted lipoprotein with Yx(FWY)xxD motif
LARLAEAYTERGFGDMRQRLLSLAILALAVVAGLGQAASTGAVDVIPAGQDPLETEAAQYDPGMIPADFFDPGSDPFTGTISFQGLPIGGPLGTTDTIIQRMAPASVPAPYPSVDTVPIELVSLSLVSIAPITVTYFGGFSPELWDVQLVKSNVAPSTGSATITKQHPNGGVFTTALTIQPRFEFRRIGPPAVRSIEPPDVAPYVTNSPPTVWEEACALPNSIQATSFCWGADPLPQRVGKPLQSPSSNHSLYHACTDNDLDGVPDCIDNCPNNFNPLQEDNDGDGTGNVCDPTPDGDVSPGFVYLESVDPTNYDSGMVPADFFDPGSDPFTGTVVYGGDPLGPFGMADTLIERLAPANLPAPYPSVDTVPIELVQLSLTSSSPITVTYFGGFTPELWDVHLERSNLGPSQGTMTITKTHPNGGVFTTTFNVAPRFIFTRQSDSATRILEYPDVPPYITSSGPIPWSQPCSPPYVSDTDFCLEFHEFGHSIQDAQAPNFSTQTVRQACVDADGDGVSDCIDNCLGLFNPAQTDSDGDGLGDPCDPTPNGDIVIGQDYYETVAPASYDAGQIPLDFFYPGSDPFPGLFILSGDPVGPGTGTADTIIQRLAPANLPTPYPSTDTVPIEIIALSLVSTNPIIVTSGGGQNPQLWDLTITRSNTAPSLGNLAITKTSMSGGTFSSTFTVQPKFTFTRQSDQLQRILEPPQTPPITLSSLSTQWYPVCETYGLYSSMFCPGSNGALPRQVIQAAGSNANHSMVHACTDSDQDGVADCVDNCPAVANANQANQDGDEYGDACEQPNCVTVINHWVVPNGDTDCDGYPDSVPGAPVLARAGESVIGTVVLAKCSATMATNDEPLPDAWPPDFNDSQLVNGADILSYNSVFGQLTTNPPVIYLGQSVPVGRWDLNASGLINGADILQFNPFFGKRCAP